MSYEAGRNGSRITVLASGSKGNCVLFESNGTALLFDAGFSARELVRRMRCVGFEPDSLSAIFISHEHTDHVAGAGVLSRTYGLPIYATDGTLGAASRFLGKAHETRTIRSGVAVRLGGVTVKPFSTTHDVAEPVGFVVESAGGACRVGICTDLGVATRLVAAELSGANYLVLESNHDPALLRDGPYPWALKQRISSRHGHLSNRQAAGLLADLAHEGLEGVILAHLSEKNNDPVLAEETARRALDEAGFSHVPLRAARQETPLEPVEISAKF